MQWENYWKLSFSSAREQDVRLMAEMVLLNLFVTVEDWSLRIPEKKPSSLMLVGREGDSASGG